MKTIRLLAALLMLLPATMTAQEEISYMVTDEIVVPEMSYPDLVMTRLDAIVDDTLMETSQLGMVVWDLTTDRALYLRNPKQLMRTASTMKLLTAITALDRLGGSYKFNTSLYYTGTIANGQLRGDLICKGGMDPMFDKKDMQAFVQALKEKGVRSINGSIITDVSMKDAEKWGEGWCWDDDNPTLSPLLIEGKPDFALQLLKELQKQNISTAAARIVGGTLPNNATHLCTRSHPIDLVLEQMMKESDNLYAEATFYQIAASSGKKQATANDAHKFERELLNRIGLKAERYRLADGSGLSLYNYLSAEAQATLLRFAWLRQDIYAHLLPSLPIAGEDGTLKKRMIDTAAEGNVQAKTGTVTGVSALSGYCTAPNGHRIAFSIINQGIKRAAEGRDFQDRVCDALCRP